jgi:hypothetical protein
MRSNLVKITGMQKASFLKALLIKPQDGELKAKVAKLVEMLKRITEVHETVF